MTVKNGHRAYEAGEGHIDPCVPAMDDQGRGVLKILGVLAFVLAAAVAGIATTTSGIAFPLG